MEGLWKHNWFTGFDINDEPPRRFSLEQWFKLYLDFRQLFLLEVLLSLHVFSTNWIFLSLLNQQLYYSEFGPRLDCTSCIIFSLQNLLMKPCSADSSKKIKVTLGMTSFTPALGITVFFFNQIWGIQTGEAPYIIY